MREWLVAKREADVKQVRVTSVLSHLDEAEERERKRRRAPRASRNGRTTILPEDLLGAFEVSELLGVDRARPWKWRQNGTTFGPDKVPFPAPFAELQTGPVWLRSAVEPFVPWVNARRRK